MVSPTSRPRLRPIEVLVVPTEDGGRGILLRDPQGVAPSPVLVALDALPLLERFTGQSTCEAIARAASGPAGRPVPVHRVVSLAKDLDDACFLVSPSYSKALARTVQEFRESPSRAATHAGGAYPDDPEKLQAYIENQCLTRTRPSKPVERSRGVLRGLVAPHIDPWRGALGYGHAYGAMRAALPEEAETFVLLGTCHGPMSTPFALCRKTFLTPLGPLDVDEEAVDHLEAHCAFDPFGDEFNHKREHSIEFQAVFLKHVLGKRPGKIVPILAGLGRAQTSGGDPRSEPEAEAFLEGLADLVARRGRQVVVVAGADLAHVGPRFGDARPLDAAGAMRLKARDLASLDRAMFHESRRFWDHVVEDADTRRVCGTGPIYTLLRALEGSEPTRAQLLHYEQTRDPDEGSIVSHGAVAFFAEAS